MGSRIRIKFETDGKTVLDFWRKFSIAYYNVDGQKIRQRKCQNSLKSLAPTFLYVYVVSNIHIWHHMLLEYFWPTYLPIVQRFQILVSKFKHIYICIHQFKKLSQQWLWTYLYFKLRGRRGPYQVPTNYQPHIAATCSRHKSKVT